MAKKKTLKLTPEQYWKWSNLIEEMLSSKNDEKAKKWQSKSLFQDAEIAQLKAHMFKLQDVKNAELHSEAAVKNYNEHKKELEDALGISLNGVTIDEVSHEIRQGDE